MDTNWLGKEKLPSDGCCNNINIQNNWNPAVIITSFL